MIRNLVRYTQVISVIGDILTTRAKGASFDELAVVPQRRGAVDQVISRRNRTRKGITGRDHQITPNIGLVRNE